LANIGVYQVNSGVASAFQRRMTPSGDASAGRNDTAWFTGDQNWVMRDLSTGHGMARWIFNGGISTFKECRNLSPVWA
jgi:hypothetical protein